MEKKLKNFVIVINLNYYGDEENKKIILTRYKKQTTPLFAVDVFVAFLELDYVCCWMMGHCVRDDNGVFGEKVEKEKHTNDGDERWSARSFDDI